MCGTCLETQKTADPFPIVVRERAGVDLTDYPVKVRLEDIGFTDWASLTPESIYFMDANGNPLYFWIELLDTVNQKSIIWVKIPSLPANSQITIYMHYGGSNPYPQYHDPTKVFILFDDFEELDTSKWTPIGSPTIVDGALRLTPNNAVMTAQPMPKNIRVRAKLMWASFGAYGARLAVEVRSNSARTTKYDYMIEQRPPLKCTIRKWVNGNVTDLNYITISPIYNINTWYKEECRAYETNLSWLVADGVATVTATDSDILVNGHVVLITWDAGNDVRVDWVAIAQYVEPEPAVESAEQPPQPPPAPIQPELPVADSLVIELPPAQQPPTPPPEQPPPAPPTRRLKIPWWIIIPILLLILVRRREEEKR